MAVAQPAVSSQVRQLEGELGESLFLRDRRGATLTEAGRTLLPHARSALAAAERGRASVASLRGLLHGQLRIGVSRPVDDRLAGTLGRFHRAHPEVEIAVAEEQNEPLLHAVANGEIDAALVGMNSRRGVPPSVATRLLGVEPLIVALPAGVPLSKARALTLAQLREQPMVTLTHGSGLRAVLDNACRTAGFVPRLAAETGDLASLVELAREGLGGCNPTHVGCRRQRTHRCTADPTASAPPDRPRLELGYHQPGGAGVRRPSRTAHADP